MLIIHLQILANTDNEPYISYYNTPDKSSATKSELEKEYESLVNKIRKKHTIITNSDSSNKETKKRSAQNDRWNEQLKHLEEEIKKSTVHHAIQSVDTNSGLEGMDLFFPNENLADIGGTGFRKIGQKIIHYKNLITKNRLDIRQPSKSNITGFPVAYVSDLSISLVRKLVEGKNISNEEMSKLNSTEEALFKRMLLVK